MTCFIDFVLDLEESLGLESPNCKGTLECFLSIWLRLIDVCRNCSTIFLVDDWLNWPVIKPFDWWVLDWACFLILTGAIGNGNWVVGACGLDGISMISTVDLSCCLLFSNSGNLLEFSLSKFSFLLVLGSLN